MNLLQAFPKLATEPWKRTSDPSGEYNCIAWAAGDDARWWWPGPTTPDRYWPPDVPAEATVDAFVAAYGARGYVPCPDGSNQPGVEKIVLYGFGTAVEHAARQLADGRWTSKLGSGMDIAHTLEGLAGGMYGEPLLFLSRSSVHQGDRSERNRRKRDRRARRAS